jgi:methionine-rich copper-binding protein CopC
MYTFTVADAEAPLLVSRVPATGATGVDKDANIVLTFNEAMQLGAGDIVVTPVGGTAVTLTLPASTDVTVNGATVTIEPGTMTPSATTTQAYTVTVAAGALADAAGNAYAGILAGYTFVLADSAAPTVTTRVPANGATEVASTASIVLTFSEPVLAGSGVVVLHSLSGGVSRTLAVNDATQVSVAGATLTITPAGGLATGATVAEYSVVLASGVVTDASPARNAFGGLVLSAYTFTTADEAAPVLVSTVPAQGAADVALTADLVLTFNEAVAAGAGKVVVTSTVTAR